MDVGGRVPLKHPHLKSQAREMTGWHELNPEWSQKCYALARLLAELDGKDPDAQIPDVSSPFPWIEWYLIEAVKVIGRP